MNNDDEKISSLYREAEAPDPSKTLDETILEASRTAAAKPLATKGPFSGGWPAIASIAAIIVITVILVPILRHQQPPQMPSQPSTDTVYKEEFSDEGLLKAFDNNQLKKQTVTAPAPASEPVRSLQQDVDAADKAMPDIGSMGSGSLSVPAAAEIGTPEMEQEYDQADVQMKRSTMEAADSAPFAIHTPEMWEVKISRLIAEDRRDEARTELEKLKNHYPGHTINETLLEQLE